MLSFSQKLKVHLLKFLSKLYKTKYHKNYGNASSYPALFKTCRRTLSTSSDKIYTEEVNEQHQRFWFDFDVDKNRLGFILSTNRGGD